jgi:plasmid stabilization system protein ParE
VKPIRVHPEALLEAEAAVEWYGQRSSYAAGRLVVELRSALKRIQQAPSQFPKLAIDARRMVLGRFPNISCFARRRPKSKSLQLRMAADGRDIGANGWPAPDNDGTASRANLYALWNPF